MMDILSEKGQQSLRDERVLAEWFSDRFGFDWIETPKDRPAIVDALLLQNGVVKSVVEVKCRYDLSIGRLVEHHDAEWLITWEKVRMTMEIGKALGVSSYGILYMPNTKEVLIQKLANFDGSLVPQIRLETTETQATINGGKALRTNAFIDMTKAKQYSL